MGGAYWAPFAAQIREVKALLTGRSRRWASTVNVMTSAATFLAAGYSSGSGSPPCAGF